MPIRLGLLIYPMFVLVIVFGQSAGTVKKFLKAGATGPDTARKPTSVGIKNIDVIPDAVKKGALIAVGDGRYYVNVERLERLKRTWRYITIGGTVALTVLTLLIWHPW